MSEIRLPAPVKAIPVDDAFKATRFGANPMPGAYSFEEATEGRGFWGWIKFSCPCGCGAPSRLPIGLKTKPRRGIDAGGIQATWEWDGNREAPTLTPSIHHIDHWHGFLTKGFFTQA